LFLGFGAYGQDVPGAQAVVTRDGERQRTVDAGRLLHCNGVRRHVESRAAVGFGDLDAEQPELRQLRHDLAREALLFVPLARSRCHPLPEKRSKTVPQDRVMLTQLEFHESQF
jgi:hypothetical protein